MFPNGIETSYTYNANNWVENIDSNLSGMPYFHSIDGTAGYGYDDIYQLKEVTYPDTHTQAYNYDDAGNRTTYTDWGGNAAYQYNAGNELTGAQVTCTNLTGGTGNTGNYDLSDTTGSIMVGVSAYKSTYTALSYGYDGNGNMTEKIENDKTTSYEYDYENRLNKLIFPNGSYQKYIYNHAGKRMSVEKYKVNESSPTETQYCIYDALQCNNIYEINGDTVTRYVYVWPGNEMVCSVQSLGGNIVTTNYYHCDGLGSVAAVTDGSGNITGTYKYDPFGNILDSSGTAAIYGFIGSLGVRNDDTGLSLMGARYYDSFIGRFISRDPVTDMSDSVSFNKYVYCRNNPLNLIDPKGLFSKEYEEPLSKEARDTLAAFGQGYRDMSFDMCDELDYNPSSCAELFFGNNNDSATGNTKNAENNPAETVSNIAQKVIETEVTAADIISSAANDKVVQDTLSNAVNTNPTTKSIVQDLVGVGRSLKDSLKNLSDSLSFFSFATSTALDLVDQSQKTAYEPLSNYLSDVAEIYAENAVGTVTGILGASAGTLLGEPIGLSLPLSIAGGYWGYNYGKSQTHKLIESFK
ncbi:MAG: RHS repeat-associated core domain-containing protein [Elusimicrobiota bacterium]